MRPIRFLLTRAFILMTESLQNSIVDPRNKESRIVSVAVRLIAFVVCMGFFFPNALFSHSRTSIGVASLASRSAIAKNSLQKEGPLIVLDAGHGGSDEGARVRQLQEKSITLLTALYA